MENTLKKEAIAEETMKALKKLDAEDLNFIKETAIEISLSDWGFENDISYITALVIATSIIIIPEEADESTSDAQTDVITDYMYHNSYRLFVEKEEE